MSSRLSQSTQGELYGIFGAIFHRIASMPVVTNGATADPELILLYRPTLVLEWLGFTENLQRIGYPGVVALAQDHRHFRSSLTTDFWLLAKLSHRQDRAVYLWNRSSACREFVAAYLRNHNDDRTPARVLPLDVAPTGEIWIGQQGYWLNPLLKDVGAANPAHNTIFDEYSTDPELILYLQPDIVIDPGFDLTDTLVDANRLPRWWRSLRAANAKRVYLVPYVDGESLSVDQNIGRDLARRNRSPRRCHIGRERPIAHFINAPIIIGSPMPNSIVSFTSM